MSLVILIGRILFSLLFVGSMFGHLTETEETAGYATARGVPNAKILVQMSGVLIGLGGIGLILGVWADLAALGLAAYAVIAAFWVHHFWTDDDPMTQRSEMTNFMKNLALTGAGLALFAFIASSGDALGFTITDPVFDFDL